MATPLFRARLPVILAVLGLAVLAAPFAGKAQGYTSEPGSAGGGAAAGTRVPTRTRAPTRTPAKTPSPSPTVTGSGYTITAIGLEADGINAAGQVVGLNTNNHAFRWIPSQPNGTQGTLTDLGTLGGSLSVADGVNTSGQAAGYSTQSNGTYQAVLYSGGALFNLGTLGPNYSAGTGINDRGQVVGSSYVQVGGSSNEHGFLWTPDVSNGTTGTMIDLGTLGGEYSQAAAVSPSGQVVGYAYRADGNFHAYLYTNGSMADLGTLGGSYSAGDGINNAGQVVGQAYLPGNVDAHAFLWQNGTMSDLGSLGSHYSSGLAINSSGTQIVGSADVPNNSGFLVYHAFVYRNGQMQDLNNLIPAHSGWVLSQASSINDAGQIVGYGTLNGQSQGFLLTPR